MFAPVAFEDISFPERQVMGNLDSLNRSFGAWGSYSNQLTASAYTTSSYFTSSVNGLARWGLGSNNRLLGILETSTTAYIWDANTNTQVGSVSLTNPGTIRKVVYDNLTDSWVVCGSNNFVKVNCQTTASTNIAVPTNQGTEYPSVVAFNGRAYGLPLASTGVNTAIAIFDLVGNTATTSSVKPGTGGWWGAVYNSIGTIYFFKENGGTNNAVYEYNPVTTSGSLFGTMTGIPGYLPTNLPDGRVWTAQYGGSTSYVINPINKVITTFTGSVNYGYMGVAVGQDGNVYTMVGQSNVSGPNSTLIYFNTKNNLAYNLGTQITFTKPSSGDRGYQDLFQLSDGRLAVMPGQNNNGQGVYVNYLASGNNKNNGYTNSGMSNPIMQNGGGG